MTASISRNAFIYGATESISEIVFPVILSTARYTVLAYDLATSDEARQTYAWVKDMGIALGQLAFWSVVWAYAKVSVWAEAEVQSCLPTDPDHIADVGEMVEADPFSPAENPAYATISTNAKQPTTAELRKRCIAYNSTLPAGDPRRIAGAARLNKAQALKALSIA